VAQTACSPEGAASAPDVELLPGALDAVASDEDAVIIHAVHGMAAVVDHIQRRNEAAKLGHAPGIWVRNLWIRHELRPDSLPAAMKRQAHISQDMILSLAHSVHMAAPWTTQDFKPDWIHHNDSLYALTCWQGEWTMCPKRNLC
jgi:hypothetical protein